MLEAGDHLCRDFPLPIEFPQRRVKNGSPWGRQTFINPWFEEGAEGGHPLETEGPTAFHGRRVDPVRLRSPSGEYEAQLSEVR
jgi:hypothetical protein